MASHSGGGGSTGTLLEYPSLPSSSAPEQAQQAQHAQHAQQDYAAGDDLHAPGPGAYEGQPLTEAGGLNSAAAQHSGGGDPAELSEEGGDYEKELWAAQGRSSTHSRPQKRAGSVEGGPTGAPPSRAAKRAHQGEPSERAPGESDQ